MLKATSSANLTIPKFHALKFIIIFLQEEAWIDAPELIIHDFTGYSTQHTKVPSDKPNVIALAELSSFALGTVHEDLKGPNFWQFQHRPFPES